MIGRFFMLPVSPRAVVSAGSIASAKMSGSTSGNNGSSIPQVDAKPGPINKELGLRIHCIHVPHYDKLGVLVVRRDCTLL